LYSQFFLSELLNFFIRFLLGTTTNASLIYNTKNDKMIVIKTFVIETMVWTSIAKVNNEEIKYLVLIPSHML